MVHRLLCKANILTGRSFFRAQKKRAPEPKKKVTSDNYYGTVSEGDTNPNSRCEESEIACLRYIPFLPKIFKNASREHFFVEDERENPATNSTTDHLPKVESLSDDVVEDNSSTDLMAPKHHNLNRKN
ncbi:hypothetical protein CQW23_28145 [Capsicum baccatum]|uniref:Uncharacterized protein n=1 Tax=Capsicum baccatum TaxID=33114 RepID=A0A2G2VFT0_CAPBA|nr:hypothetical protein CQW23_28145 [Capsicum baccatum]